MIDDNILRGKEEKLCSHLHELAWRIQRRKRKPGQDVRPAEERGQGVAGPDETLTPWLEEGGVVTARLLPGGEALGENQERRHEDQAGQHDGDGGGGGGLRLSVVL